MISGSFEWRAPTSEDGGPAALISSVRVHFGPAHDVMQVWIRGALAGELTLPPGEWHEILAMLTLPVRRLEDGG
jgi:hypothetical protein